MKYKLSFILFFFAAVAFCDWPTGGTYQLRWGAHTNGGTEADMRTSSSYKVSDNVGQSSHTADSFLADGVSYINRPGYRKVEWDERKPITSINDLGEDSISSAPNFPLSWGGADTTIEDGYGWGIHKYDVQYQINSGGWQDWHIGTFLTSDIFGPHLPTTVYEDSLYCFRCRARDLVGNLEDWPPGPEACVRYVERVLEWIVVNYADSNDWTVGYPVGLNQTVTADSENVFIVKNYGTVTIDIGAKGYPATGWDLERIQGSDAYALKARFNDDVYPPVFFVFNDALYDTGFVYATPMLLGTGGFGIKGLGEVPTPDSTEYTENLWLQLKTPTGVSVEYTTNVIRIDLKARPTSP